MTNPLRPASFLAVGLLVACHGGGSSGPAAPARLVLAANTEVVAPVPNATRSSADLRRLGLQKARTVYRVTTPANEPFAFDLVAFQSGAQGSVEVGVAHVSDGGVPTSGGSETLAVAGIVPSGSGLRGSGPWITAFGDGLARLGVQGRIERDQTIAVTTSDGGEAVVEIAVGEPSVINQEPHGLGNDPSLSDRRTIYSSDSWQFGMPTVAVSGDRTSVVVYEGDRAQGMSPSRYEMRMQYDAVTQEVTGGGTVESSSDQGSWRDHEIAALYNVLAAVRNEIDGARVRLSFDRGATFGEDVLLTAGGTQTRLAQLAIAADYTLAIVFWQALADERQQLVLVTGHAVAFDPNGSPTWFQFDVPQIVSTMPPTSTPLTNGLVWSSGGDLVVGYGATWWEELPSGAWQGRTEFRCATQPFGEVLRDVKVDEEILFARDPSVAVLGQGASMRIFYAYEVRDGVRLATSGDAGASFPSTTTFGTAGAYLPSVFARDVSGASRVDVLYLAAAPCGSELHHSRWLDFGTSPREDFQVTASTMSPTPHQAPRPIPGGMSPPIDFGWRLTQIGWLGYDAALAGDHLTVVIDEVTYDAAYLCFGSQWSSSGTWASTTGWLPPTFSTASPPPLAPGMTRPLPAVDASHAHQLQLLRID